MTVLGVDFGGSADARDLFAAGASFAVARCITELGTLDDSFHADVRAIREAGLIAGGYHWLVSGQTRSVKSQAQQFVEAAGQYVTSGPFLTQLDVEPRTGGAGPAPTWGDVADFVEEYDRLLPGKRAIPYGGSYLWATKAFGLPSNAAATLPDFWLSRYPFRTNGLSLAQAYARVPADAWNVGFGGWKRARFLQFEGTVGVPGASGVYDLDAFDGSIDQLRALAGGDMSLAFSVVGPGGTFVAGEGHQLFRLDDPTVRRTMDTGERIKVGSQIRLAHPLDSYPGDRQSAVLFIGNPDLPAEAALLCDGTFTPGPAGVASVTVQFDDGTTTTARIA